MRLHLKLIMIVLFFATSNLVCAQFEFPSPSPEGSIAQVVGNTKIVVEYERPAARGRKIYGGLVPWNEIWRTGAGKCTRISFDKAVIVGNQPLEAGAYSLFTIPNKEEWLVIFNSDTTLNGAGHYDSKKDVARFPVKPKKSSRFYEAMTIDIDIIPNNAKVFISWTDTQIDFDIHTTADEETLKYIDEQLLTGKEKDWDKYGMGAWYLSMKNTRYNDALILTQKMMQGEGNDSWGRNLRYTIYAQMHLYDKSLEEIEKGLKNAKARKYEKEEWRQESIRVWNDRAARVSAKQKGSSDK